MALRFSSGSATPARSVRNSSLASTATRRMPWCRWKVSTTCSASPWRSRPWSTKTQVRRSPMARCTSVAATALSTPPLRPQMTWPVDPTCRRICSTVSWMKLPAVQSPLQPQMRLTKLPRSWPPGACARPRGGTGARRGGVPRRRSRPTASCRCGRWQGIPRQPLDAVAVAHPDLQRRRQVGEEGIVALHPVPRTSIGAEPYSRSLEGATWPPSAWASSCRP